MGKIKTLNHYLKTELDQITEDAREIEAKISVLNDLVMASISKSKKYDRLRTLVNGEMIDMDKIKSLYQKHQSRIIRRGHFPHIQTTHEKVIQNAISQHTRIEFYPACWIGGHCVDLFIPSLGLVLEINGQIHYQELKMRKDNHRDQVLMKKIGLMVMEIKNEDVSILKYKVVELLMNTKRLDSKKIKRIWRDIYIHTIARVYPMGDLSQILGFNIRYLAIELGYLGKGKSCA